MRTRLVHAIRRVPILGDFLLRARTVIRTVRFPGSAMYWDRRYKSGGTSGVGSAGDLASFKAEVLNGFVQRNGVGSVIEFGCGDGRQLLLSAYPRYIGLDVSPTAIRKCISVFADDATKSFFLYEPSAFHDNGVFRADLSLSIDVIFHLVEDSVFETHIRHLFAAARRYVIIYSSEFEQLTTSPHERHRNFSGWVAANVPGWEVIERIPSRFPYRGDPATGSYSQFVVYGRS